MGSVPSLLHSDDKRQRFGAGQTLNRRSKVMQAVIAVNSISDKMTRMSVTEVLADLPLKKIQAFCERYSVEEFSLFGSVLREDFGPASDIDVMLKFKHGHGFTFENTPDIQDELELIFGREVDVIEKGRIRNPIRRHAIMNSYRVVYAA
jgi:predicted nucleotidyltransferase